MSSSTIRDLNDSFRTTFEGGRVMLTEGVQILADADRARLMNMVRTFTAFDESNDPYGEHDFGAVEIGAEKFYFKIDYYDRSLRYGSPDPCDPSVTTRVLTVMRADEY